MPFSGEKGRFGNSKCPAAPRGEMGRIALVHNFQKLNSGGEKGRLGNSKCPAAPREETAELPLHFHKLDPSLKT
jgi:hypothetical protein